MMDTTMQSAASSFDLAKMQGGLAKLDQAQAGNLNAKTNEEYRKVAEEFEGMFAQLLIDQMSASIETDGITGGGNSEKIYRGMLNQEYGKSIAQNGGLGIADHIYNQLVQMQEV